MRLCGRKSIAWRKCRFSEYFEEFKKEDAFVNKGEACVVVLDAAVLLKSNWYCDEVWVVSIHKEEAVKRIMERDGKTEEQATGRLDSNLSTAEMVNSAHVVLSTMWEKSETDTQVARAVQLLKARLGQA